MQETNTGGQFEGCVPVEREQERNEERPGWKEGAAAGQVQDLAEVIEQMSETSGAQTSRWGRSVSDATAKSVRSRPDPVMIQARCMGMLGSDRWNHSHPGTYNGYISRLRQFREEGLPAMRVLSHETIRKLRRIPHSREAHQQDAVAAIERNGKDEEGCPNAEIIYVSHHWLRPNWCERMGQEVQPGTLERNRAERRAYDIGEPDDADGSKAKALIEWGRWYKRRNLSAVVTAPRKKGEQLNGSTGSSREEGRGKDVRKREKRLYYWIDFACCDQDDPASDLAALPAYVAASSHMLVMQTSQYAQRAWCQVELLLGYAFMESGYRPYVVPAGFKDEDQGEVEREMVRVNDPRTCELTNPNDMPVIAALTAVAQSASPYTCGHICYDNLTCRRGWVEWTLSNVCCLCQLCGLAACDEARTVKGGRTTLMLSGPAVQLEVPQVNAHVGTVNEMET